MKEEMGVNSGKGHWIHTKSDVKGSAGFHTIEFQASNWHDMLSSVQIALHSSHTFESEQLCDITKHRLQQLI